MRIRKKVIAALLFTSCLCSVFGGCKKKKPQAPPRPGQPNNAEYLDDAAITVDGVSVSYREAMLYLQAAKAEYESAYGGEIWQYMLNEDGTSLGEWVKEQTLEKIIYIKIVCSEAKRRGIELDSEEKNQIGDRTEEYMRQVEYEELALYGIGRKDVESVYTDNAIAQKLYDSVTLNVDTDISDEEAAQKRIQSMMLKNYHEDELGNRSPLTVMEMIATLDKYDSLFEEAKNTKDFYSLAFSNTDDKQYLDQWVAEGELPSEFSAAYGLNAGEAMQLRLEDGFYIFYCASDYDEEVMRQKKEELIALRQEKAFSEAFELWRQSSKVEINEVLWKSIGFDMDAQG